MAGPGGGRGGGKKPQQHQKKRKPPPGSRKGGKKQGGGRSGESARPHERPVRDDAHGVPRGEPSAGKGGQKKGPRPGEKRNVLGGGGGSSRDEASSTTAADGGGVDAAALVSPLADPGVISANWLRFSGTLAGKKRSREESAEAAEELEPGKKRRGGKAPLRTSLPGPISSDCRLTKVVALDCEMVGVGLGGVQSILGQVVIVNSFGNVVYEKFVRPQEYVTDLRTEYSGLRIQQLLQHGVDFNVVQQEVAEIIKDRIVVGHGLSNDFRVLLLSHPYMQTRDTARYRPLMKGKGKPRALKQLAASELGVQIQEGEHDPGTDAWAALLIYKKHKQRWEKKLKKRKMISSAKRKRKLRSTQKAQLAALEGSADSAAPEDDSAAGHGQEDALNDGSDDDSDIAFYSDDSDDD